MALAPASMVRWMSSSVGPPVAMMGMLGKSFRMAETISGVLAALDTLRISAPEAMRRPMSISRETMVAMTGMSTTCLIWKMVSSPMGALTTTP